MSATSQLARREPPFQRLLEVALSRRSFAARAALDGFKLEHPWELGLLIRELHVSGLIEYEGVGTDDHPGTRGAPARLWRGTPALLRCMGMPDD